MPISDNQALRAWLIDIVHFSREGIADGHLELIRFSCVVLDFCD
jgi:hypothetical protein